VETHSAKSLGKSHGDSFCNCGLLLAEYQCRAFLLRCCGRGFVFGAVAAQKVAIDWVSILAIPAIMAILAI
jgi:hypothetical protein